MNKQNKNEQLIPAIVGNDISKVKSLINEGAIDFTIGFTGMALKAASEEGHTEIVKILLDAGANEILKHDDLYSYHYALNKAKSKGHTEIVKMLENADVTIKKEYEYIYFIKIKQNLADKIFSGEKTIKLEKHLHSLSNFPKGTKMFICIDDWDKIYGSVDIEKIETTDVYIRPVPKDMECSVYNYTIHISNPVKFKSGIEFVADVDYFKNYKEKNKKITWNIDYIEEHETFHSFMLDMTIEYVFPKKVSLKDLTKNYKKRNTK